MVEPLCQRTKTEQPKRSTEKYVLPVEQEKDTEMHRYAKEKS
jgi:hypothetical protein